MPSTSLPDFAPPQTNVNHTALEGRSLAPLDERRVTPRVRRRMLASIVGFRGPTETQQFLTVDLSEDGLFLHVPVTYGVTVGQRYEVVLGDEPGLGEPSALSGERRYATVVRTEPVTAGAARLVGAGLRFDQPLFL